MNEKELLQELDKNVQKINATITKLRNQGLIVNVTDLSVANMISEHGPLKVTVVRQIFSSKSNQYLTS